MGVPFYLDSSLRAFYSGSFFNLFGAFPLWCGLTSLAMLAMHGGLYLAIKTDNPIRSRAIFWSRWAAIALIALFAGGGWWVAYALSGYDVVSGVDHFGYSNPLHKEVSTQVGAWMQNYSRYPYTIFAPVLGFVGAIAAFLTARLGNSRFAFVCSSVSILGIITTVGVSMFPFILPSSTNLASSLLVWDASSSRLTLMVMLFAAIFFLPIILLYTAWVYRALRGKVSGKEIEEDANHTAY